MHTVAFCASKGGVGKTTLATAMAVEASRRQKVALFDSDSQQSMARWHELRDDHARIEMIDFDKGRVSTEAAQMKAARAGADWLIIDTPPGSMRLIEPAVELATFVVIPIKPSPVDMEAVDAAVDLCRLHEKPFAFVINMAAVRTGITQGVIEFLKDKGTVFGDAMIMQRQAWLAAMALGQSGAELDRTGKCAEEIAALWSAIRRATQKSAVNA